MTEHPTDDTTPLSPVKLALLEIRDLRARLAALETAAAEPIAVIGLGCRLPGGVHDEASLWRVLADAVDTIGAIPAERWDADALYDADPDRPGTMWTRAGGFLDDVAGFDAAFFGVSPREAASMDPQQRLVLEVAWHALEDAAIAPDSLAGSKTGVFVGVGNGDYGRLLFGAPQHIDAYAGSGGSLSVVAGRLAYVLGLQGPALAVDTACSASLVAVHLACQSLRSGECDLALVAGVNLILTPDAHIAFTKARMMALDGRCKTFDAAADGYGRGEGAVVLVLRRQRDAQASGDRQLALIRASAVNQDGRSGGLTAPNGPAQEAVIRAALAGAGLQPGQIDYVEAHGTGTSLGDPIELQALAGALGAGRSAEQALWVGSCKTNFGHLEAAAGLAGMAKTIAALRRRQIPPHLHFTQPNPLLDWASMPLRVPTRLHDWPAHGAPARAGVSSFGFSGTNAHVILEQCPDVEPVLAPTGAERPLHLLALSARDEPALRQLVGAWRDRLAGPGALADLCFTANAGRAHFGHRLALRGASAVEIDTGLAAWLAAAPHPALVAGVAAPALPKVAFLFTGQGAQYHGMARGLYRSAPVFRATLDACAKVLDGLIERPLLDLLFGDAALAARLDDTALAQPALFSVEVALAALWRSWGVEPAVVLGHSLGEYAAACVAGILPLEDTLRVLVQRGRLTQDLPGDGAMASVFASEAEVRAALTSLASPLDIAALNGPRQVVVSGARGALDSFTAHLEGQGVRCRALRVSHAFHSALIEPVLAPLGQALARVSFGPARCEIVSNLTGGLAAPGELSHPGYWLEQMRAPVRFADALRCALAQGVTHVIEIGPHPVLLGLAADCADAAASIEWLPSLRRDGADWVDLLDAVQRLYVAGARVDWQGFDRGHACRRVAAPLTPFQHRRHWIDWAPRAATAATAAAAGAGAQAWQRVAAALDRQSDQAPVGVDVTGYGPRWAVLERLTVAHAATVLRDGAVFRTAGERATTGEVRERLGAGAAYHHLIERWLLRLVAQGALQVDGEHFVSGQPLADPGLPACQAEARDALADNPALLAYVEHCGRLLASVIRGRESPLETLFPGGSFELAEGIYQRSAPMRYINALAAGGVEALVAARGANTPLRVLEIGAGTGSTSAALMPVFAPASTRYWFTDITPAFFDRAREKFAPWPFVRCTEFNLERDAAAQGFAPASFDLVIAANAVHATRHLRDALGSIRRLLAPGGLLLLVESTEHLAWFDMTTGLIEGWQHFDDDLRDDNPLLPADTWRVALREAGFAAAGAWPPAGSPPEAMGQKVIAAWVAGEGQAAAALPLEAPAAALFGPAQAAAAAASDSVAVAAARRDQLRQLLPAEQLELLRDVVREAVSQVLRLDASQPPGRHDRFTDLGMDSLMAVQLRNRLGITLALARPLPATLMFDHPTIEALAQHLHGVLDPAAAPAVTAPVAAPPPSAAPLGAAQVAAMSEADIEALLLQRLGDT